MIKTKTSKRTLSPGKLPHVLHRDQQVTAHKLRVTFCTKQKKKEQHKHLMPYFGPTATIYRRFGKPRCPHLREAPWRKGSTRTNPMRELASSYEMHVTANQMTRCHMPQNLNRHINFEIPVSGGDTIVKAIRQATLSLLRCHWAQQLLWGCLVRYIFLR